MHRGYVKIWRKIQDSEHFAMGLKHVGMFDTLLILANHKKGYFFGYEIHPGQYATSLVNLSDRVHETQKVVRRLLEDLQKFGMITVENRANRFSLITICNWRSYQATESNKGQTEGVTEGVTEGSTEGIQSKNEKNEKNEKSTAAPTWDEFSAYCKEKGFGHIARRAYDGYEAAGWHDSRGKKIKSWRQKLVHVWFDKSKNPPPPEPDRPCDDEACRRIMDEQRDSEEQQRAESEARGSVYAALWEKAERDRAAVAGRPEQAAPVDSFDL
jgi:hypothetical protein